MAEFRLNPNFENELLASTALIPIMRAAGEEVATEAQRRSQWGNGSIARGIKLEVGPLRGKIVARVVATDFKSHWFQFGTAKMHARPFLTDSLQAKGYVVQAGIRE